MSTHRPSLTLHPRHLSAHERPRRPEPGPARRRRAYLFWAVLRMAPLLLVIDTLAAEAPLELTERLRQTRAVNLDAILEGQFPRAEAKSAPGFRVANPYTSDPGLLHIDQGAVCGLRFASEERLEYQLSDFASGAAAGEAGYLVTHDGRCGTCSTLQDLAVYLSKPDLTTPARRCARRWGARRVRQCFIEEVGFTPACAESWAYNALQTRGSCRKPCVETYGLLNLLLHRYPAPNNDPDGALNACLQCDETHSGPGFRYSAGRTRRGSGIRSAIARPESELFPVDHAEYFAEP